MTRRRVIVYRPSFAALGGGELQASVTAAALAEDHDVVLCGESLPDAEELVRWTGVDLGAVRVVDLLDHLPKGGAGATGRRWQHTLTRHRHVRLLQGMPADAIVCVEHARPFPCPHPAGVYSCLFPHREHPQRALAGRAYDAACRAQELALLGSPDPALESWSTFVANSAFTAEWVQREWDVPAQVVHPPCPDMGPPLPKEPWILNVARFAPPTRREHDKCQDALIEAFRSLRARFDGPCELHLAGYAATDDPATVAHLAHLRDLASGLPVTFHTSVSQDELRDLYRRSSVFWLATGHGTDPDVAPNRQEHFGIVTVEAMSAGAVPVARGTGGSVEILRDGGGRLWRTLDELVDATVDLLRSPDRLAEASAVAQQQATRYSIAAHGERMRAIVDRALADVVPVRTGRGR